MAVCDFAFDRGLDMSSACVTQAPCCQSPEMRRWQQQQLCHTQTNNSAGWAQTRVWNMCVRYYVCYGIALAKYNIRQQVKSYLIELKSPEGASLPRSIVFAIWNRAKQNGSTELSFHTVISCCSLLDPIKTSQIREHNCSTYLLQWKSHSAVLTQMFAK